MVLDVARIVYKGVSVRDVTGAKYPPSVPKLARDDCPG